MPCPISEWLGDAGSLFSVNGEKVLSAGMTLSLRAQGSMHRMVRQSADDVAQSFLPAKRSIVDWQDQTKLGSLHPPKGAVQSFAVGETVGGL